MGDSGSWVSLIPFLIIIPLSILTKQILPGLFVALLVGSYIKKPSIMGGLDQMLYYVVHNLIQSNNIRIILFLYVFAGMINMTKAAGGIKGFVHMVSKKVKNEKAAMFLIWITTFGTFSDPDFRIVTIGPIMKALRQKLNIPKQKIGFAIEATANPVVAMIPIATGFVGYMVSVIDMALKHNGIARPAYTVYVSSIPFNFFSIVTILGGIYYSFFRSDKKMKAVAGEENTNTAASEQPDADEAPAKDKAALGKNLAMESSSELSTAHNAVAGDTKTGSALGGNKKAKTDTTGSEEDSGKSEEEQAMEACHRAYEKDTPAKPWNLILPVALMLTLTLFLSWWDGHTKAKTFFGAFLNSDALGVMLEGLLIALIFTLAFFLIQRIPIAKLIKSFTSGGNELMPVILLLALIWAVTAVSQDLGFSKYITANVSSWIPHMFIAPVIFLLGALISYFIGSSWGTWGLLMPLGITIAHHAHANLLLVIGAVFASGTFGSVASPLSDNTVTLCTIMDMPVMKFARQMLVPCLILAGVTTVLYGAASFVFR